MGGDFGFLTSEDVVVLNPPIATDVSGSEQAAVWICPMHNRATTRNPLPSFSGISTSQCRPSFGHRKAEFRIHPSHGKRILSRDPEHPRKHIVCGSPRSCLCALSFSGCKVDGSSNNIFCWQAIQRQDSHLLGKFWNPRIKNPQSTSFNGPSDGQCSEGGFDIPNPIICRDCRVTVLQNLKQCVYQSHVLEI